MPSTEDKYAGELDYVKALCAGRERTSAEIIRILLNRGLDQSSAEKITGILKKEKFIDEKRYASAFIRDKVNFQKWGMIKIRYALTGKGIPPEVAEEAILQADKDVYRAMISNEIIKKQKSLKDNSPESRQKLIRFCLSRGYEMDIVYHLIGEIS
jgi:regulatory protein